MTESENDDLRETLRDLAVFDAAIPSFDPDLAPEQPADLFLEWLRQAIAADVREPHAMTVSTVDADGRPNSRVLILKDLTDGGWQFAASRRSAKGQELAASEWVALNFHWRELARQVRVRGRALEARPRDAARDFRARSPGSRAAALTGKQSQLLDRLEDLDATLEQKARLIRENSDLVPEHWALFNVIPSEVEFWQADPERKHLRLQYRFEGRHWRRRRLWP